MSIIPKDYKSSLTLRETEKAIKQVKDVFQQSLSEVLVLQRVSAPRFVRKGTGVNDDLNGIERKVSFRIKADDNAEAEIVFSLAKWKRLALAEYGFRPGEGLYTDMDAIRPDEEILDNLHSIYVDQWDWEKVMRAEDRHLDYLKKIVRTIYDVMRKTEAFVHREWPDIAPVLPEDITFVHTEELQSRYPALNPRQREDKAAEEYGAVFVIGIGGELADGTAHDGRAPDYDDWTTPTSGGKGLNGDILVWNPILDRAFELSSMGIRVDREALLRQLEITGQDSRQELWWHRQLLEEKFPQTIGGGIGQSRLCMFFLRKAHIGEVQASLWPEETVRECAEKGVRLL